jgi:quercetin dioxygenase-like cupin family protein
MNPAEFEARLRDDGFTEVVTAVVEPNETRPAHAHDYDVEALVLEGDITLTCDGAARTYRVGDTFGMAAGRPHAEAIGSSGVRYLVGRRRR